MSLDFEVQRCTRKCAKTERAFEPGESFYSMLRKDGADVVREDFCNDAWDGPPESAIAWWQSQMPDPKANKITWAPNDVMLNYFQQIRNDPSKSDTCFVLSLLMVRRRLMRMEETERDDKGNEVMVLFCPRAEEEYRVLSRNPSAESVERIQAELATLLFAGEG